CELLIEPLSVEMRRERKEENVGGLHSNYKDASSATVGKVRDLASFRRHFRMGFMTMPASQDLSPHSCAAAMAPRSQSCHAMGTGEGEEMENGYYPDSDPQNQSNTSRCPPAKPKRHPNTRLSSTPQQEHLSRGVHKSDSGEMPGRKVPPLKPKRSPSTQLSFDTPPPRVPPPTTPHPFQSSEPSPLLLTPAVSISHSSPLPSSCSSASSTPVPQALSSSPHPPRAPTPFLLPGSKPEHEPSSSKIPAPFPNLLQHKPPLLAFPQPAAASSGVGAQHKTSSAKISVQSASSLPASTKSSGVEKEREKERREGQLGPAPGLRARSHSTPLPPSSKNRERERDLSHSDTPASNTYTHTSQTGTSTTPTLSQPPSSTAATPPSTSSSSTQRPPSRSHMHRSHTPHLSHGLPTYKPPPSDSPLLWTYPSVGFRRPPAYDSLRGGSQLPSLHTDPTNTGSAAQALQAKAGFIPWESAAALGLTEEQVYWPMHRKLSFSHGSRDTEKEDGGAWNGSADALLRRERDDLGAMRGGGHSGIPVRATERQSESLAGVDGPPGLRGLIRAGLPLPCQTFPACRNGELGRLGRSSSTSGVRQVGGDVQRQSSLPAREALNQLAAQAQAPFSTASAQRDGKLLEVIERKRCLCKEIKAHRRPDKSLCKQDSMPILPSWRKTPEPRKTGTPPCQRPQAVVWDTAI
uniref:Neuronal tyrosine-phosphorylated phosphoinositide-3-kinase adapter 1-like n=1 Tax=Sinocyclocheilus rhinocerous TaxID=307959 RepID=A0A673FT00_9TELE